MWQRRSSLANTDRASGVARSLAVKSKSYRQTLISILEKDPSIVAAAFDEQFRKLILEPLSDGPPPADSPLIIVIDALDECDEKASLTLSKLLKDSVPKLPRCINSLSPRGALGWSTITSMIHLLFIT